MWLLRAIRRQGRPFVFYLHPWELDPHQPRVPGSVVNRFRHYWNLPATARRLEAVLDEFGFAPLSEVVEQYTRQKGPEVELVRLADVVPSSGTITKAAEEVQAR
jgi:hypothetical protein